MIITRTPYRISLAGGGTDFPEWFRSNVASVVSATIDKYSYITCRQLPGFFDHNYRIIYSLIENVVELEDIKHPAVREILRHLNFSDGLEIHHDGDLPARTGVGSSSAFTVGLLQAILKMQGINISKMELAKLAIKIERDVLGENVGMQDQIACTYGGLNKVDFIMEDGKPNFRITPFNLSREKQQLITKQIKLIFTGKQRFSSLINSTLIKNLSNQSTRYTNLQKRNVELAFEIEKILLNCEDYLSISQIFEESWSIKRQINPDSITVELEEIKSLGLKNGASGAKILGAGGGGFIAFWVIHENQEKFNKIFKDYVTVDFDFENEGSKIIYEPNIVNLRKE